MSQFCLKFVSKLIKIWLYFESLEIVECCVCDKLFLKWSHTKKATKKLVPLSTINKIKKLIRYLVFYTLKNSFQECRYRIALPENYTIKFSCDDFRLQVRSTKEHVFCALWNFFVFAVVISIDEGFFLYFVTVFFCPDPFLNSLSISFSSSCVVCFFPPYCTLHKVQIEREAWAKIA